MAAPPAASREPGEVHAEEERRRHLDADDQFQDKPGAGVNPEKPQGGPDMSDPTIMKMVKTMFDGFKIAIDLEVVGSIVKTNAEYVKGSRMTLLEMDLGQLFEDQEKLKALQGKIGPGASLTEVKPYLKDVKGVKINDPTGVGGVQVRRRSRDAGDASDLDDRSE